MRVRLFAVLAAVLALVLLELGSFALLSLVEGEAFGYADLRRLRESRRRVSDLEVPELNKDWDAHRMVGPPALHPYVGYVTSPTEDPRFSHQAADFGLPGNPVDLLRPVNPREVVIGVFGGSFAANLAARGRPLAAKLASEAETLSGKRVTVISFALPGHKQPQQLMALNWFLSLGVHLDVVVNLDGFNEVALPSVTNVPKQYHPFYPRGWPVMVADLDQELRRRQGELSYLKERRAERADWFSRLGFSLTAGLVWKVLDGPLTRRIGRIELELLEREPSPSGEYQARGPEFGYESEAAMYDDLVAMWKRSSLLMDGLCRSRGIRYLHFLQPNQYVPDAKPLSRAERRRAWRANHPYRPAVVDGYPRLVRAGEELAREGVSFHDLTRIFADDESTYYRDACCHINAQGNVRIAEAMARAIDGPTP